MENRELVHAIIPLWQSLHVKLIDIYDPHTVCEIVAVETAAFSGCPVLLGLRNQRNSYYDLWMAKPATGEVVQGRWPAENGLLQSMMKSMDLSLVAMHSAMLQIGGQKTTLSRTEPPILSTPLRAMLDQWEAALGGVCLISPDLAGPLNADNFPLLISLVDTYLDRAFLRYKVNEQEVEFDILQQITHSLTATLDLNKIYDLVANLIRRALNVETLSIGFVDSTRKKIHFVDSLFPAEFVDLDSVQIDMGQGIAGWCAEHKEAVTVNNVKLDIRFFTGVDQLSGFETKSILCVPVYDQGKVIAVLEAINKKSGDFLDTDLRLLQTIADSMAVAIVNANLHEAVLAEKHRTETVLANMSEGLIILDHHGRVTGCNEAMLQLLQQELSTVEGAHYESLLKTKQESLIPFVSELLAGELDELQIACDLHRDDKNSMAVLVGAAPVLDTFGKQQELILVFTDLSHIREIERMRDDFFHNIVHELRTPLATILLYARLLREKRDQYDSQKQNRFIHVIEKESDRLQQMVRDMLMLAKLEARQIQRSEPSKVDLLPMLVELTAPMHEKSAEKGIGFVTTLPTALPLVAGYEDYLYRIFKNLIENAVKFTIQGAVQISAQVVDEQIKVKVIDEGIGIAEESIPNLFTRFFRTKTAIAHGIAGTGLGLYLVREGVALHNGTIDVESELGAGTTFTICLPIDRPMEEKS